MTSPIESTGNGSKIKSTDLESVEEALVANSMLASLLAGNISVSTAQSTDHPLDFDLPRLETPASTIVRNDFQLQYGKIISMVLDAWAADLKENAELQRQKQKELDVVHDQKVKDEISNEKVKEDLHVTLKSKVMEGDDVWKAGMTSILALYAHDIQRSSSAATSDPATHSVGAVGSATGVGGTPNVMTGHLQGFHPSSALTSALIIAAGFVGTFKTSEAPGAAQVDSKVLQDAWNQMAASHNPGDPATQVAGWVSALWGIGLTYFTAAQQVGKMDPTSKEPVKDLVFAVKFAENLMAGLASGQFLAHINAIVVSNTKPGEKVNEQRMHQLSNTAKIVLLTVALAQIMKLELGASFKDKTYEGHLTGDSVLAMLQGKINFQSNDPHGLAVIKAKLIVQINNLLAQIPDSDRAALMANMKIYFDKNPSVEKLSDVNNVVGNIFSPGNLEEQHLQQNSA